MTHTMASTTMTQLSNVEISLNGPEGRSKSASPFYGPEAEVPVETLGFQVLEDCVYQSKNLGSSNQEALGCDCGEHWDAGRNVACGEDSDCINRLTKVECVDDECSCGAGCQNQRFQLKQYAAVSVIKTEKKGHGLRARTKLEPDDFIFEYIGEVINEAAFRRRMIRYDEEGIKHFYFMSLQNGVFIDATKKGNLGRFCNHSCRPNCYVDKWVVGDKLRMGIFAKRHIKAGEELVFNYNVDRYGADPQPCYCGEPNCTGFIGGKTQTERATKLPTLTLEALGIDDGEDWDIAVPKRPKKKRGEDDTDYVDRQDVKTLDETAVPKVISTLMRVKEKWIVVKLLSRVQRCDNERVWNRLVQMHGYQTMKSTLLMWQDDVNIVLQVLDILRQFPRLTKNKIIDSKIEPAIEGLTTHSDERVQSGSKALLDVWQALETAYRIPRKKRDPNESAVAMERRDRPDRPDRPERRDSSREGRRERESASRSRSRSRSRSPERFKGSSTPVGPRQPGRPAERFPRRPQNALPHGWSVAYNQGQLYYYSTTGERSWSRPTMPVLAPPPPPPAPKAATVNQQLQAIIDSITMEKPRERPAPPPQDAPKPAAADAPVAEAKEPKEKWRSYGEEKRKKLYENTLFPHIQHVMNKYKQKLPREDLKRFGKEVAKKLVASDFKHNRVEDPTKITAKQEKLVKKYVSDFLDKAVAKKRVHDVKKAERRQAKDTRLTGSPSASTPVIGNGVEGSPNGDLSPRRDSSDQEKLENDIAMALNATATADDVTMDMHDDAAEVYANGDSSHSELGMEWGGGATDLPSDPRST